MSENRADAHENILFFSKSQKIFLEDQFKKEAALHNDYRLFVLLKPHCRGYFCVMKNLYDAIREMRELSAKGIPFSFAFMSYNSTAQSSEGIIEVRRAKLRKRTRAEFHNANEMIEEYTDLDTLNCRRFYQPLLMAFNGEQITIRLYDKNN